MFHRIPSDLSEIVVVLSGDYKLYKELKRIVKKFNDKNVNTRVRDKLTRKSVTQGYIDYELNNKFNREYDKPFSVC